MGKKKKKEKIIYIDDGSTIADMSGVKRGIRLPQRSPGRPRASFSEQWQTYLAALKLMITPMCVVIVGMGIIYMVLSVLFWLM